MFGSYANRKLTHDLTNTLNTEFGLYTCMIDLPVEWWDTNSPLLKPRR